MLKTGTAAPDFTLPDQDGKEGHARLAEGQARRPLLLPKADTPG